MNRMMSMDSLLGWQIRLRMSGFFCCLAATVLVFSGFSAVGFADTGDMERLSSLELRLFSVAYGAETVEARLSRLEKSVFGQVKTGTSVLRLTSLERVITKYQSPLKPAVPAEPAAVQAVPAARTEAGSGYETSLPDATDYPTVISLERTVFARDFVRDPLPRRLERLENKVFGRSFPQLPMADRVDNLLMRYPQANLGRPLSQPQRTEPANLPRQVPMPQAAQPKATPSAAPFTSDVYAKLSALETRILGPSARQDGKLLTERLDVLERKIFGFSQSGGIQQRVDHLVEVTRSSGNAAPSNAYSAPGTSLRSRNIQIGAGMSSQSQSQYSPELMNMLPNDLRQRIQQGNAVQGTGGSVTMTETTTAPSGFYTLPNGVQVYQPPMQYQQTYQLTPTVISPGQSAAPSVRAVPESYPKLDALEMKVFNHINQTDAPEMRLWKLESYLTRGQSFGGYSIDSRIENAWKIYQYQYLGNILQTPASPPQAPQ